MTGLMERAERFTEFLVSKAMDEDGIILSSVKGPELRPWRNEDFEGYEVWDYAAPDPAGLDNYEDAIMATGYFVVSQVMRYRVEGAEQARRLAERGARAILAISREGDKVERGYLPKPHGGLANAAKSRAISSDQYEHALFGLWHVRSVTEDDGLRGEIDEAIVKWADYFVTHDFAYLYFGRLTVTPELAVHGLGLLMPLMVIAGEITGDPRYREAMDRRLMPVLRERLVKGETSCGIGPNVSALITVGLFNLWNRGVLRPECAAGIKRFWEGTQSILSADGYAYVQEDVSDDNLCEPGWREWDDPLNFRLMQYHSNAKTSVSVKVALIAPMVEAVSPGCGAVEVGRRILERFDRPEQFLAYVDPDGRQVPDSWAYYRNMVVNGYICDWVWAACMLTHPELLQYC